jgi:hypothetical protein
MRATDGVVIGWHRVGFGQPDGFVDAVLLLNLFEH